MFRLRKSPCALEESLWKQEATTFQCSSSVKVYHCIPDENNRLGELCVQPVWVKPNYCPEYNTDANTLDTVPCKNESSGSCPSTRIWSYEIYKYPVCLNKTHFSTDGKNVSNGVISLTPGIYIGVAVAVSLFIILFLFVFCICKRRQHKKGDVEIPLIVEKSFYKTSAFHEGVKFINNGGKILCLVGRWGSGKRSTAKQIYWDVTNSSPIIISDLITFDVKEHCKPIIVDMTLSIGISNSEKEDLGKKIHILFENMSSSNTCTIAFIIFLVEDRKSIAKFVRSLEKERKFIDLAKSFTKGDRKQILSSQFDSFCRNENFCEIEKLAIKKGKDHKLGYSEICTLFCRCTYFQTVGPVLFRNRPLQYLKSYIQKLHDSEEKEKFLMLVFMSLNQMEINVNNQNDILFEILESCNCVPTRKETKSSKKEIEITGTESTLETSNTEHASSSETKPIKRIRSREGVPTRNETKSSKKQIEITGTESTLETSNTEHASSSETKPKKRNRSREDIISLIPMEFVNKLPGAFVYRLQHDVIKRMALIVFGTYHFDKLLELSKPDELKKWVKKQSKTTILAPGDIKPVLEIRGEQWSQYQEKIK